MSTRLRRLAVLTPPKVSSRLGFGLLRPGSWGTLTILCSWMLLGSARIACSAQAENGPAGDSQNGSLPDVSEILQNRVFHNKTERDIFFLQRVRQAYPTYWGPLLSANITLKDYVAAPDKLLRFIEELSAAAAGTDDRTVATNLAAITGDPAFYANAEAYRPQILRAAASALIQLGPAGRKTLAESFNQDHYRLDSVSLELFGEAIGQAKVPDTKLVSAVADTVFALATTNGGFYPRCTRELTRNLLLVPGGQSAVAARFQANSALKDPGRFQAVVEGVVAAHASGLTEQLTQIALHVAEKLKALANYPGPYYDDLSQLQNRLHDAISQLQANVAPGQKTANTP